MEPFARFSVSLPASLLAAFDAEISRQGIPSRSDALRKLIHRFTAEQAWEEGGPVCGTLTLLYDHGSHDAAAELTELQHAFPQLILCTTHVHMEAGRCMEVVLLRGSAEDFRCFVRAVSNLRAVLCAEPVVLPVLPPSRAQEETSPGSPSPHPLSPLPSPHGHP